MAKNKSQNKSGYKYKHKNTTVLKVDDKTKVIAKKDKNDSINMPQLAEDGDKTYITLKQNLKEAKQIRDFNELVNEPTTDIDLDHDHGQGLVHAHDWVDGKRQKSRPATEEEKMRVEEIKKITIPTKSLRYYEIDEKMAKRALESYSFNNYAPNSETISYQNKVDEAFDYADKIKSETDNPELAQKADYLADLYAKKYANWINNHNRIQASVPSAMIVGPANFPTHKKEKQLQQLDKSFKELEKIEKIKEDIKYLKYKTERTEKQGKAVTNGYNFENKHFEVIQNEEQNRLQLKFEGKPSAEMRDKLKHNGFKWSPSNNAWQRQLTPNARYATQKLIKELDNVDKN